MVLLFSFSFCNTILAGILRVRLHVAIVHRAAVQAFSHRDLMTPCY